MYSLLKHLFGNGYWEAAERKESLSKLLMVLHFTFHAFVTCVGSVNNVSWALSIKTTLTSKGRTFITDDVMKWLSLLYNFIQQTLNSRSAQCRCVRLYDKRLKAFCLFRLLQKETSEMINIAGRNECNMHLFEICSKSVKLKKVT